MITDRMLVHPRCFRGHPNGKSFDGRGQLRHEAFERHIVFPEIDFDKVDETWGMRTSDRHHGENRR